MAPLWEGGEEGHDHGRNRGEEHEGEKHGVVLAKHVFEKWSADPAGDPFRHRHDACRKRVVRHLERAGRDLLHHVEHVADRTEAEAELLDGHDQTDPRGVAWHRVAEIKVGEVGNVQGEREDEEGAAQRHLGGEKSAEKRAGDEGDRTDRAVDVAHGFVA